MSETIPLERMRPDEISRLKIRYTNRDGSAEVLCSKAWAHIQLQDATIASLRAEVARKDAALEKAEGNFYNMANTIDDADYRGSIPGVYGVVVGHREEYHKGYVQWLVKYAEEARAARTPSQEPRT